VAALTAAHRAALDLAVGFLSGLAERVAPRLARALDIDRIGESAAEIERLLDESVRPESPPPAA
jgi:hypothetical protein